jgi:hypothetical protein
MRSPFRTLLALLTLTVGGCGHAGYARREHRHGSRPLAAAVKLVVDTIEVAGAIAEALTDTGPASAVAEPSVVESVPARPVALRQSWIDRSSTCGPGREFHLRRLRAATGDVSFFETQDGRMIDCVDEACQTLPPDLLAWCDGR